ncbi:cation:proton antiporter [Moraxella sp. FZFQ2102]|uniref:cation:proton antiporter n=1 Tax=Moraxella sp. FZFQ2102 TaxID=2953752 RepID=UPI00209C25E8|nr:cation:proton antiporter [Moraxella sp. FZFQ2102]USZ14823.1 cation:proton antiporter [Moraxella sp. FZFQ2102]
MGSFIFLEIFAIVCIVSITTTLFNKRILGLPQAIGVPIVSAVLVFILQWLATLLNGNQFININITAIEETVRNIKFYDFLINGVICFILTSSALKFQISDLKHYWKQIGILASIALLLCAIVFGVMLYGYQALTGHAVPLIMLLLLGSALGATDPIGVKGVLSSIKAPRHLIVKLEGESLFNDAMCIAIFMTILRVIQGGEFHLFGVIEHLLYEVAVAVIIGVVFGRSALYLLKGKNEMESLILITALLAAGSYLVALYAEASAPIACVVAGLIVGNRWQQIISQTDIEDINHFWHTIEGIINSFLFTLIGLELFILDLSTSIVIGGVVAFVLLHCARFIANFVSFAFFPSVRKNAYNGSLLILSWGGVRGGISLALILAVANIPAIREYNNVLIGYTFIVVLLSGVVSGLGLPAVINAFYHNPNEPKTGFMGFYQRLINRLNRTGQKYVITEDAKGNQLICDYDSATNFSNPSTPNRF